MISDKEAKYPTIDTQWTLLMAFIVLSLVLALKRVYQRRNATIAKEKEEQAVDAAAQSQSRHSRQSSRCEQISKEEYNYQSSVVTRNEIMKLVHSEDYKDHMQAKGGELENWNWQANDRKNGIYPLQE